MPKENTVFCSHCEQYLPRKREREHRRLLMAPAMPPPVVPSRLRRVITVESDSDDNELPSPEMIDGEAANGVDDEMGVGAPVNKPSNFADNDKDPDQDTMSRSVRNVLHHRWGDALGGLGESDLDSDSDSDFGSDPTYPRLEDSDDES
jgi:hypothetical protein